MADVGRGHQPLIGDAVINDGPGLLLIVEKLPWGNTLEVTRGVEDALDELRPGLPGVEIDTTIFRPADLHRAGASTTSPTRCCSAALLVVVILVLLPVRVADRADQPASPSRCRWWPRRWCSTWRGATINTMVLAGLVIALGEVVDDAIIDVENIVRRLRQHRARGQSPSRRRASSSTPRSRCAARSSTPR